jgi:hypothetical protein
MPDFVAPSYRKKVIATILCGVAQLCSVVSRAETPAEHWFDRALVGLEVGPTGAQFGSSDPEDSRYCRDFDGAKIVQETLTANADYLVLWVRDGDYAYYNSRLLRKAPGLGQRDPLQESIRAAAPAKLPIIAYCVVQQAGHFLTDHPQWAMRDAAGKPIGRFCLNSGYQEAMKEIVSEIAAQGVDGFHIDMLDQGFGPPYGCWCDACQQAFQSEFGHPMPPGQNWDEAWAKMLEFRYKSSERFERELFSHIKRIDPRLSVDFNYHGNPPFSFEVGQRPRQHAQLGDFITGETGVWGFSALGVGLNAEFYRASVVDAQERSPMRFQVAMQRGVRMYHDQTTRPLTDLRWELLTLLAHGAFVTIVDKTGLEGRLDPLAYERLEQAFADAKRRRENFGQPPRYDVGIYFSSQSRDWLGREQPGQWLRSFLGAHRTTVYEHLMAGVVLDESIADSRSPSPASVGSQSQPDAILSPFPVLLLPNVGILTPEEVQKLRGYVGNGGRLVITGQTAQFAERGSPLDARQDSSWIQAWEELIGAEITGRLDSVDNWVTLDRQTPDGFCAALRRDWPFLVKGPATIYRAKTARGWGQLQRPSRTTQQREGREGTEWPMSPDEIVGPAILVNEFGKGRVITIAASPDAATASEHATVEARRLLSGAIDWIQPQRRVRIEAPANVETVITEEPGTGVLRVHCLGYFSPAQAIPASNRPFVIPALLEDEPIYRLKLVIDRPIEQVTAFNSESSVRQDGQQIEATIVGVHDVLKIICK